jgi:hypothetical protein
MFEELGYGYGNLASRVRSGNTHFRVIRAVCVLRLEYALEYAV